MPELAPPATNPDELADLAIGAIGYVEPGDQAAQAALNGRADAVAQRVFHSGELADALDQRMRQLTEADANGSITEAQLRQQKALLMLQERALVVARENDEKRNAQAQADSASGEHDEPTSVGDPADSGSRPDSQQSKGTAEAQHRRRQRRKQAASAGSGAAAVSGAVAPGPAAKAGAPASPASAAAAAARVRRAARPAVPRPPQGQQPPATPPGPNPNRAPRNSPNRLAGNANQAPKTLETLPAEIGVFRQIEGELDDDALSFDRLRKIQELVDASVKNVGGNWIHVSDSRFKVRDSKREIGLYQDTNDGRDSINKLIARVIEKSRFEHHLLTGDDRRDVEEIVNAGRLDFGLTSVADEPGRRNAAIDRAWRGDVYDYRAPVGAGERSVNSAVSAEMHAALGDVEQMRKDRIGSHRLPGVVPRGLRIRGVRPVPERIQTVERDPATGDITRYLSRDEILGQLTRGERQHFEKREAYHARELLRAAGAAQRTAREQGTQDSWRDNLRASLREQVMAEYKAAGHSIGEARVTNEVQRATVLRWAQLKSMAKMELHNQIYGMKLAQLAGRPNTGLSAVSITGMTQFNATAFPALRTMRAVSRARYGRAGAPNASLNYAHALETDSVARAFLIQEGMDEGVIVPRGETPAQRDRRIERARRFIVQRDVLKAAAAQRVSDYVGGRKINSHVNGMWVDESIRGSMPLWYVQRLEGDAGRLVPAGVLRTPFEDKRPLAGGGKSGVVESGDAVFYSRV